MQELTTDKLVWNSKNDKMQIEIYGTMQAYDEDGEPNGSKKAELGKLKFMDKKDVVRFGLNVAKNCGIGTQEFAKLANEVMNEMGDWK